MGYAQGSGGSTPRNPGILSRDRDGNEHLLFVADEPASMITVSDGTFVRIMTPSATVALILELTHALGSSIPARPFSGGY